MEEVARGVVRGDVGRGWHGGGLMGLERGHAEVLVAGCRLSIVDTGSLVRGERHGGCGDFERIVWDWCGAGGADGGAEVEAGVSAVGAGFGGGEFVCGADGFFDVAAGARAGEWGVVRNDGLDRKNDGIGNDDFFGHDDCGRLGWECWQSGCAGVSAVGAGFEGGEFVGGAIGLFYAAAGFSEQGAAGSGREKSGGAGATRASTSPAGRTWRREWREFGESDQLIV